MVSYGKLLTHSFGVQMFCIGWAMASVSFDVPTVIINMAKSHAKMQQKKELMRALSATCVTWLAAVNDSTGNQNMPSERERT